MAVKIAYIHPRAYPSQEVNALQALRMAAGLSEVCDTTLFIPRLEGTVRNLKQLYGLSGSCLPICAMRFNLLPGRLLLKFPNYFERTVSLYLRKRPKWRYFKGQKVLFVRDAKELLFWSAERDRCLDFKDWTFIFEAHSTIGLRPNEIDHRPVFQGNSESEKQYHQAVRLALQGFDHVICVTQAMQEALASWTEGLVRPVLVRHASPLPRSQEPPEIQFKNPITVGYIGQISQYKGVDLILQALAYFSPNIKLRLVGRFKLEGNLDSDWLQRAKQDPALKGRLEIINPVPIQDVTAQIDACDILIQPASSDILNTNYEAPLKSFDYMVRGKPIIAADVPCHRELYREGENALFYDRTPEALADRVNYLAAHPEVAQQIAEGAWKRAEEYNYQLRANKILSLLQS